MTSVELSAMIQPSYFSNPRQMTFGRYLIDSLSVHGVKDIYTVPGDFIMNLCRSIEQDGRIRIRTLSHEPAAAFAAQGMAVGSGNPAVICATYGVSAFNIVNPVAAAYAERIPLLVICGAPGLAERFPGVELHHHVQSYETQRNVFSEITAYQAIFEDPRRAPDLLEKALNICRRTSRPVYFEISRGFTDEIVVASKPTKKNLIKITSQDRLAAFLIRKMLVESSAPVIFVGIEVKRYRLADRVIAIAENLGVPMVTTFFSQGTIPIDHPLYGGTWIDSASPCEKTRQLVAKSQCNVLLGAINSDFNMAPIDLLPSLETAYAKSGSVNVAGTVYKNAWLPELVDELYRLTRHDKARMTTLQFRYHESFFAAETDCSTVSMRMYDLISELNRFFRANPQVPLVTDVGDCLFSVSEICARQKLLSGFYAAMGCGVPIAFGLEQASGKAPIVLTGNCGFQISGMELANARRVGSKMVVIIINNSVIETQSLFGGDRFMEPADLNYAQMARAWGIAGHSAATAVQFRQALLHWRDSDAPALIEVRIPSGNRSSSLKKMIEALREKRCRHCHGIATHGATERTLVQMTAGGDAMTKNISPSDETRRLIRFCRRKTTAPAELAENRPIRIRLFGNFSLTIAGKKVASKGKAQLKPLALLKCLLAKGGREVSTAYLQDTLWPDADGDRAVLSYKAALHRLRSLLGDRQSLCAGAGALSLNEKLCWTDLWAFEDLCRKMDADLIERDSRVNARQKLQRLLDLYQGPFLPDEEAHWAIAVRRDLSARFSDLVGRLAGVLAQKGEAETTFILLQQAVRAAPEDEFLRHVLRIFREKISIVPWSSKIGSGADLLLPSQKPETSRAAASRAKP